MARTITEIATEIKKAFANSSLLRSLYDLDASKEFDEQFSAVSIETLTVEVHATAGATIEEMHEWHRRDITKLIDEERYGHANWYTKMMKAFQLGHKLNELEEKTYYDDTTSDDAVASRIIKFAYAFSDINTLGVTIKIAKEGEDGLPTPLDSLEVAAATSYINRIKPAGIPIKIVNEKADILDISVKIVYDPLVFSSASEVDDTVKKAIEGYLYGIKFNGSFVSMNMIDQLQETKGISIALVSSVKVNHALQPAEDITELTHYIPMPGAMELGELEVIKEEI